MHFLQMHTFSTHACMHYIPLEAHPCSVIRDRRDKRRSRGGGTSHSLAISADTRIILHLQSLRAALKDPDPLAEGMEGATREEGRGHKVPVLVCQTQFPLIPEKAQQPLSMNIEHALNKLLNTGGFM